MVGQRGPLSKTGSPLKGERNRPTKTSGAKIIRRQKWEPGTFREVRVTLEPVEGSQCTHSVVRTPCL